MNCEIDRNVTALLIAWLMPLSFAFTSLENLAAQQMGGENLIRNGTFQWTGEKLTGWDIAAGAGRGNRLSSIARGSDGSLELSGDSRTQTWNFVGQSFDASPGDCFQLSYTAKANDVRQQRGQNRNCYAGIFFKKAGRMVGNAFFTVSESEYTSHQRLVTIPDGVDEAQVTLFLSMTGTLNFKDVSVRKQKAEDSFDALVAQMDRYYSYFDHKGIDWKALTARYRESALKADDAASFQRVIKPMLAELKDGHVWFGQGQRREPAWKAPRPELNFDFKVVDKQLKQVKRFGRMGLVARTVGGVGYVRITSLQARPEEMQKLVAAVESLFDTQGIVIDLRANGGGSEDPGRMIAGLFCRQPTTYAINRFRKNGRHNEFDEFKRSPLQPDDGTTFEKPAVCLIGPGAVSSAEGMALMFKALPNVTLMGQPTRGSSGNPAGVKLPNGVEVFFSRWVACDAQGQPIEDHGVQPDEVVEHADGKDPTWQRALESLLDN